MVEIERKFLVTSNTYKDEAIKKTKIVQGFLNSDIERTVRVRVKEEKGFLTVKGKSSKKGLVRYEWESEISVSEANMLLKLCEKGMVEKIRYEVKLGEHLFEIDEFCGDNKGLVIAEIELDDVDEEFIRPSWLGKEVTGQAKYYNSQLGKHPFKSWKK